MVELSSFFLVVLIVSLGLTLITFALGAGGLHIPGLHPGAAHVHIGAHAPQVGHNLHIGHAESAHPGHGNAGAESISPFNMATILAFLTWFGGVGYLLTRFSGVWLWLVFFLAIVGGIIGGAVIFWISLGLISKERPLDPADYEMVGVLGSLTSGIRPGGVGELCFSQEGVRRSTPARSDDGGAIAKGAEVLVTRYEKGIAYVKQWEEVR